MQGDKESAGRCGKMTEGFFEGKKVFVTGHTGFKGSWLTLWLKKLGADVTGFALEPPTNPSMFDICGIKDRVKSTIGDVRDRDVLGTALKKADPQIIFHLAAQSLVRVSYDKPVETFDTNVMGTVNLLDAIRRNCPSVKAIVVVTSDKCYENQEAFWGYRETDRLGGYDPYSNSKACQELVTSSFVNSFYNPAEYGRHGIAIATARAGNVIGGGDFAMDRLLPDIIRNIINKEQLIIRNPQATRPWQHVMDPLFGYLTLAERLFHEGSTYCGAWNFGPESRSIKSVDWMVKKAFELWGWGNDYKLNEEGTPHETNCLKLDSFKAYQLLHYRSGYNIENSLKASISWYKSYLHGISMYDYSINQIEEYEGHLNSM